MREWAKAQGTDATTMALALLDGVIAVTGTLWFLSWLRRRWSAHGRLLGQAARTSYATHFIHPSGAHRGHGGLRVGGAGFRGQVVLVAAAGVAACFMAGSALTRVPGISTVL